MAASDAPPERAQTDLLEQLQILGHRVSAHEARLTERFQELQHSMSTALKALELIHDDDPGARRQLHEARTAPCYEDAFTMDEPLVSVVIPTWNRVDTLIERAIPSALRQTHENVEVIVVGDASPPEVGQAIAYLDDPRVTYRNLTVRGPYPDDRYKSWLASGTPGINAAVRIARGQWIAPLGDDDAFVPNHIARLLAKARQEHLEFVYGFIRPMVAAASQELLGGFPPACGQIGLQAAIYHAGLRFMELELGHALFDTPNDWGLVRRMMRIGVRMGMIDDVTVEYWPSRRNFPVQPQDVSAETADNPEQRAAELTIAVTHLRARVEDLEKHLSKAQERGTSLQAYAGELSHRLEEVRHSRSWRFTAPLRRMRSGP
jgi:chaperonin cofactor prefoldin